MHVRLHIYINTYDPRHWTLSKYPRWQKTLDVLTSTLLLKGSDDSTSHTEKTPAKIRLKYQERLNDSPGTEQWA